MTKRQNAAHLAVTEKMEKIRVAKQQQEDAENTRRQKQLSERAHRQFPKHALTWKEIEAEENEKRRIRKEKYMQSSLARSNTSLSSNRERKKQTREELVVEIEEAERKARVFVAEDPMKVSYGYVCGVDVLRKDSLGSK